MVRTSTPAKKTSTPTVAATPAPTPVVEAAAAPAPAKKASKKATKTVVETAPVVVDVPPTPAPIANEVVATETDASTLSQKINEFGAKLQQLSSVFATVKVDFKTLEKTITRELKAAQKSSSKKARRAGNRSPSGFVKPTLISDELATFLGKESGTEMARTAVSKEINNYIRANQLQDKENGRKIHPDAKLTALLKIQSSDELTYFNLQKFMKHHFIKTEAPASATA